MLECDKELQVVGEAGVRQELLNLLDHTPTDVVLMDVNMPVMDGFETLQQLKKLHPEVAVIVLTMLDNAPTLRRMMESVAIGYLLKDTGKDELCSAIKLAVKGTPFISSGMSIKMMQKVLHPSKEDEAEQTKNSRLSKRELEILSLI